MNQATSLIALLIAAPAQVSQVLPSPSGPHAIGTMPFDWTDSGRPDPFPDSANPHRRLAVQLWYPAARTDGESTPYLADPEYWVPVHGPQLRSINQLVRTHAKRAADLDRGIRDLPVILFSPGANQTRRFYQSLFEEWASHGFLVAAIAHPHANRDVYPDGRRMQAHAKWSPPARLRTLEADKELHDFWGSMIEVLSQDQRFVMDQLNRLHRGDLSGPFAGRISFSNVIVAGHSRGAKAAFRTARTDPRVTGCIIMDDPPPPAERAGLPVNLLVLTRDQPNPSLQRFTQELFENATAPMFWAELKNTSHMSFSDLPLIVPREFGLTPEAAHRNMQQIRRLTRAFLSFCVEKQVQAPLDPAGAGGPVTLRVTRVSD